MRTFPLLLSFLLLSGCLSSPTADGLDYLDAERSRQELPGRILVAQAVVASGLDLRTWPNAEEALVDQLGMPESYGDQARLLWVLATTGLQTEWNQPLEDALWAGHDGEQFGSPGNLVDDALAVSALVAAGTDPNHEAIQSATAHLRERQSLDGGWTWDGRYETSSTSLGDTAIQGEPDETAFVLQALRAANALDAATERSAVRFLEATVRSDGSYAHQGTVNCQSTGLALLAWSSTVQPAPPEVRSYVESCQNPDGGFPHIKGGPSQVWATAEILQGLAATT